MKYLKTFEQSLTPPDPYAFSKDDSIEKQIKHNVVGATYDDDPNSDDIGECPFAAEMAILHQQEYIDETYENMVADSYYVIDVTLEEFKEIYNELIETAKKKISDDIKEDPSLYGKWLPDYIGLDIPDWLKSAVKYNI